MAKLEGIKACVFDAYGTLFDVHAPVQKLAAEIGDKADDLAVLWRQKQLEYTWLRSLMGVHADFWHVTGDALDYALDALKIEDPGLKDELMVLYLKLDAYPDVAEALKAVRAKSKRTAILSNGSPPCSTARYAPRGWKDPSTWFCRSRMSASTSRAGGSIATPCRSCNPGRAVDLLCLRQ